MAKNTTAAKAAPTKAAAKQPAAPATSTAAPADPPVLSMQKITGMKQDERIELFKAKDALSSRLTVELGKLLICIRDAMEDPSQATRLLKDQGIKPGTVNTASNTAKVYKTLVPVHISEEVFDTLDTGDLRLIAQIMSGNGKKRLTAEEVANFIGHSPATFGEEFESLFSTGMTVADCEQEVRDQAAREAARARREEEERLAEEQRRADETARAVKEAEEATARAAEAERVAAEERAERERLEAEAAERDRLEAERLAAEPPPTEQPPVEQAADAPTGDAEPVEPTPEPAPVEADATPTPDTPPTGPEPVESTAPAAPAAEQPTAPVEQPPVESKVMATITPATPNGSAEAEPPKTIQAQTDAALDLLLHVERITSGLPAEAAAVVGERLAALAAKFAPVPTRANVVTGAPGAPAKRKRA